MIPVRPIASLDTADRDRLMTRGRLADPAVAAAAAAIIERVRGSGDRALLELARELDGVDLPALEVPREDWGRALQEIKPPVRRALEEAAEAIRAFHAAQRPVALELEPRPGVRLGRRPDPLRRVGVYAPGGRAAYPSSVLMGAVPARVAGVGEVVVCSPPGPDGRPSPLVLAACAIAGVDRLFALGGAGAVAALAYGTASVLMVDRIVGPGNAYVTAAKQQVASRVGIDAPAGPSELLIVADDTADPRVIAGELLAQAEHDPDAAVVLVSTSALLAEAVARELAARVPLEPRREIIEGALQTAGALLVADSRADALAFAEAYAPEHLLLLVDDPRAALADVRCAGTVFLGPRSSVAFGDYATGANHVLPTGGLARSWSGLAVDDFVRWTTWQEVSCDDAAARLAAVAAPLADAEGLPAHAAAARAVAGADMRAPADRRAGTDIRARPDSREPDMGPRLSTGPTPRPPYRSLDRYAPARRPLELDLSANTNLWGACPPALAALRAATADPTRYPTPWATDLRMAVAEKYAVDPRQVTTGCGSDDLIDSAIRAFCPPGGTVSYPSPTFPMAEVFARMNDARPRRVPLEPDGSLDPAALDALSAADVVYLCRPNNPTGALLPREQVERVLGRARGLVLIDEAYGEFAGETLLEAALASGRGLVLRTFSKAYGLAGLRVGYALGPEPLITALELSRGPYKVSAPAEAAAVAAIREGGEWVGDVVRRTVRNRKRLATALSDRGYGVAESAANFLLFRPNAAPAELKARVAERGVGVRTFDDLPGFGPGVRVTIGPWAPMERFLAALEEVA